MQWTMATGNANKVREIRQMLEDTDIKVLSLKDAGLDIDIEENGATFEENAVIKAETICALTKTPVLADDSGLEIDALDGAPGIHSARFLGEDTSYAIKNAVILKQMEGVAEPKRTARFVCAVALACPNRETMVFRGTFEGRIAYESKGENGFGYDPIFYVPEKGCTSAELSAEEKNAMSHRGKAMEQAVLAMKKMDIKKPLM